MWDMCAGYMGIYAGSELVRKSRFAKNVQAY